MRLRTIWTIPAMTLAERLRRTRDWTTWEIGSRLPLRLRYFVALSMIGKATMDSPNVPATPLEEVLKNLEAPNNIA